MTPTVYLVWCQRRGRFVLRWRDDRGRWRQRQTAARRRPAEAHRQQLEAQLRQQRTCPDWDWSTLWSRYLRDGLASCRPATLAHAWSAKAALERCGRPDLVDLDAHWCAAAVARLTRELSAATAASYARRLRALLRWAAALGLCPPIPVKLPAVDPRPRGRALTLEELERLELAASSCLPADQVGHMTTTLRAAWWSGLRLGELLDLHWTDPDHWLVYSLERWPCLQIPAGRQKSRRWEVIPCAPEFARWLRQVPPGRRTGFVLRHPAWRSSASVGRKISQLGRRAGILVAPGRWATAHDLRRSFALRWAEAGLAEAELAAILRHRSVATTRQFYETIDAQRLGERWKVLEERMCGT